jgi:hypothetical protein
MLSVNEHQNYQSNQSEVLDAKKSTALLSGGFVRFFGGYFILGQPEFENGSSGWSPFS